MIRDAATLSTLLVNSGAVLFDFDGPLCDVFSGLPAPSIARRLELLLDGQVDSDDPLDVLRHSVRFGSDVVQAVERELIAAELEAVATSSPTPGGLESVGACLAAGKKVGVVSNNSAQAVIRFLERYEVLADVHPVIGRAYANPTLMKPHPYPLKAALASLKISPNSAIFVGDSLTDIEVGRVVGTGVVAYANNASKRANFRQEGVHVVHSMFEVVTALRERA